MVMSNLRKSISLTLIVAVAFLLAVSSCSSGDRSSKSANASPTATPLSEFESSMKAMKTVNFDYIFVFKRKDGEAFDSDDKKFLKDQTYIANRRDLLKDEKTILIGSNYEIEKKRLDALKERFEFEDHSKPPEERKNEKEESNANVKDKKEKNAKGK